MSNRTPEAATSNVTSLRCRECGRTTEVAATHVCGFCFGPLEVVYDPNALAAVTRESIEAGPPSMWRYAQMLPDLGRREDRVDLGAGLTPLVRAPRLGAELGLSDLWIKNDTLNPSFSFKDRVVSVALSAARQLGFTVAACASTGNLANSVAAHAASVGMDAYVFIPADLEPVKILTSAVYGPKVIAVEGSYDEVNRLCGEVADDRGWAFVNVNVRPFYAEGSKSIGFEAAEQLGWRLPAQTVAPMASGSMLVKIDKAYTELLHAGLVDDTGYRIFGAQAAGCSPIATAFLDGSGEVRPVKPSTIAKSLAIGDPADGYYALDAVNRTKGAMEHASDAEIVEGIRLLARTEGIFGETAGGVTIACLKKLAEAGVLDPDETTVAIVSGVGLKTTDVLGGLGATHTIRPKLGELDAALTGTDAAA